MDLTAFRRWRRGLLGLVAAAVLVPTAFTAAQAQSGNAITLLADIQEANANTGIITARGNVRIRYPAQAIFATSAQAQYYSRERRIVLTGDVNIQQEANQIKAEVVTYLIDEGRFVAEPLPNQQVESTYVVPAGTAQPGAAAPAQETIPIPAPPADLPAELGPIEAPGE
ncbi:hypothetical protein IQ241_20945 [Romeria aff. gracilis LEGE 07310]|uniref:Organic solvent tolerance-like N-terminal domain-containing protein n=1 Tax=Vasconcelosia minhoensis LEGE 07310 TaxID=915328 RepID=A0A8J7AY21_9CYAN|nr:LptA/OstA family protein [Romeria gracilis]MBE9079728.1 hypothetical protein [Romeria aff. gracilis LEGE 07310]